MGAPKQVRIKEAYDLDVEQKLELSMASETGSWLGKTQSK
jgi:hypothetical protein